MVTEIPSRCQRCQKKEGPKKIRYAIWPLEDALNGNGAWLCRQCWKEMQSLLTDWMNYSDDANFWWVQGQVALIRELKKWSKGRTVTKDSLRKYLNDLK